MNSNGANQYRTVGSQSGVENASPHRLIQMLIDGVLERVNSARGHMERGDVCAKGENISSAISIIGGLQASLDIKAGGAVAENLDSLYEYMGQNLMLANQNDDLQKLDQISQLMLQIKSGWDGIEKDASALANLKVS